MSECERVRVSESDAYGYFVLNAHDCPVFSSFYSISFYVISFKLLSFHFILTTITSFYSVLLHFISSQAMETHLRMLENRADRRERELSATVDDVRATSRIETARLQATHAQECREKDEQLVRFQGDLELLVRSLRQWQQAAMNNSNSNSQNNSNSNIYSNSNSNSNSDLNNLNFISKVPVSMNIQGIGSSSQKSDSSNRNNNQYDQDNPNRNNSSITPYQEYMY